MSKNTGGSDSSNESEGLKPKDSVAQNTATDAVIGGTSAQTNQDKFFAQKSFDNQQSPSDQFKTPKPGETPEQYAQRVGPLENNSFELINSNAQSMLEKYGPRDVIAQNDTGTVTPFPKPAEPEYIPGYTKQEAMARRQELLQKGNWNGEETNFLSQMERKIDGRDQEATPAHPAEKPHPLEVKAEQKVFKLDAEAEEVKWKEWQERLKKEVFRKLEELLKAHPNVKIPVGSEVNVNYTLTKDGRFGFNCTYNDQNYANLVMRAINETVTWHPELKKFPEGTAKTERTRLTTFNVRQSGSGYSTGDVESEIRKK